jgi:hypothetical protein
MTLKPASKSPAPEAQLRSFIARFGATEQKLMRSVRTALRKRLPTANELVYDYNHSVVIGYSPTDRGIESILSISLLADGVRLYLMNGPQLPDPKRLLLGTGKQVRFIQIEAARRLSHPDVKALIAAAVDRATVPLASKGKGSLVIKSEGTKRARRSARAK